MFRKMILLSAIIITAGFCALLLFPSISDAMVVNKTSTLTTSLNNDLVEWLTFDAKKKSGATFTATVGNNGTATGATIATGIFGQGVNCDGVNDVVAVTVATSSYETFSIWVKPHITPSANKGIIGMPIVYIIANTRKVAVYPYANLYVSSNSALPLNKWSHIAFTIERGLVTNTTTLYINGVREVSGAKTANMDGTAKSLCTYSTSYFDGQMDDFRVYNRYLTTAEIQQLYKMGGGKVNKSPSVITNLNTGLVGWWTFDAKDMTSVTTTDKSGNGNNCTRFGVVNKIGKIGQGLKFDGTDDYLNCRNGSSLNVTTFTWSLWVKKNENVWNDERALISNEGDADTDGTYALQFDDDETVQLVRHGDALALIVETTVAITDQNWHHIVATRDSAGNAKIYIDSIVRASDTLGERTAFTGTLIGKGHSAYDTLNGQVDDVRIYNRALSATEIMELYKMGGGKVNKTPSVITNLNTGLVGWWTFDGKKVTSVTTTDSSGNRFDGTKTGGLSTTPGKIGQALLFNGTTGKIQVTSTAALNYNTVTVSAWVNPSVVPQIGYARIAEKIYTTSYYLGMDSTGYKFKGIMKNSVDPFGTLNGTTSIVANRWYHVVVTHDGANDYLYVNGVRESQQANTQVLSNTTYKFSMGVPANGSNSYYWKGKMDDVRIYSRALSTTEIYQLYKMGK